VPLVFDEVITGFRLAPGGAQEFFGVTPDLAVFGKALGSGFPIGVLAGSEAAMAPLDPASPDGHRVVAEGSTLGNPVSATAALATLDILSRPGTYDQLHRMGESLGEGLRATFARRGTTIQLTGVGPIIEFYVSTEPVRDYRAAMRTDMRPKSVLAGGLPRHGVLGGGGRYNISLAHGDTERDLFLKAIENVLDETA
jgi:glutamate-1-semialdehyde 2,1-aminomutase